MLRRQRSRKSRARSNYPQPEHAYVRLLQSAMGFHWVWEAMIAAGVRLHPTITITTAFAVTTVVVVFCGVAGAQSQLETRIAAGVHKIEAAFMKLRGGS